MQSLPNVIAIVPIYNNKDETLEFLETMAGVTYPNLKVIVVDDGSSDGSAEAIAERYPCITVLKGDGSLWWSGATNLGVNEAIRVGADFILTINNDNAVSPDFVQPLVETALTNPMSIVTSAIYDYSNRNRLCSLGSEIIWSLGELRCRSAAPTDKHYSAIREVDCLNGTSTLIPVQTFREIGLFDRENCPQYHGDSDFFLRAKKFGYQLLVEPLSVVFNKTTVSGGTSVLNLYSMTQLVTSIRSPFYFKANYKIYREHCPYHPFGLFLAIRYARLMYSLFRRTFIDRTRRSFTRGEKH